MTGLILLFSIIMISPFPDEVKGLVKFLTLVYKGKGKSMCKFTFFKSSMQLKLLFR